MKWRLTKRLPKFLTKINVRQRLSSSIGKDGTSLPSSLSSQCGPVPCGTPSVLLLLLQRRLQHLDSSSSSEFQVFGWTDSTLTLFTLWGTLDFPLFFFPSALLLRKSLRLSVVTQPDFDQIQFCCPRDDLCIVSIFVVL